MILIFSLFLLAHAEKPVGVGEVVFKRVAIRQVSETDPIYIALARIFPNFMSFRTRKLDVGLYKFAKDRWRKLDAAAKRQSFMNALERTTLNPTREFAGRYFSDDERIELSTVTTRSSRKTMAHELQHAFDYANRPFATSVMNPLKTAMLEWRAALAEREFFEFSFSRAEIHEEWWAVDRKIKTKVERRPDVKENFHTLFGRLYWPRDHVDFESESAEAVIWRATISEYLDYGPRSGSAIHLLAYIPKMIVDVVTHPVALVCELALMAWPYLH